VLINFTLVIAVFLVSAYFSGILFTLLSTWIIDLQVQRAILWGAALIVSAPFLIAAYRKLQGLSMILAELSMKSNMEGYFQGKTRSIISEVIPVIAIMGMLLLHITLSANILPTLQ
jgi:monovalent cation:H+ antiporter-2, CPA2 family